MDTRTLQLDHRLNGSDLRRHGIPQDAHSPVTYHLHTHTVQHYV